MLLHDIAASVAKTLKTMDVIPTFIKLLAPEGQSALLGKNHRKTFYLQV